LPSSNPSAVQPAADLESLAIQAGEAWANACAEDLRAQRRPIVGGWPGTLSEARVRVLALVTANGLSSALPIDRLRALSRTAYGAARASWLAVSGRDEEE
jgi:hypothetical protein